MKKSINKMLYYFEISVLRILRCIAIILLLISQIALHTKADYVADVVKALASITCESTALADIVVDGKFSNTCTPNALSNIAIANILSPGVFVSAMSLTKINSTRIWPLYGNCLTQNRANPSYPTITFAMCSNALLVPLKAAALVNILAQIASSPGTDIMDAIKDTWNIDPNVYHLSFQNQAVGSQGLFADIGIPIPWIVTKNNDKICVSTYGILGLLPIGCKYIREPMPVAKYDAFMNGGQMSQDDPIVTLFNNDCSGAGSCFATARSKSMALASISGPLIFCVRQMLVKVLISDNVCDFTSFVKDQTAKTLTPSTFFKFQQKMQNTVSALLVLYTIAFGFNVTLGANSGSLKRKDIVMFPIKMILVLYFSVGINIGSGGTTDGISTMLLPLLFEGASQITSWIGSAGMSSDHGIFPQSQLCNFQISDYKSGDAIMLLWDTLDCKVSSYLGLNALQDVTSKIANPSFDSLNFSIPPWMYFLAPAIYSGDLSLVILVLMYPILVISVAAYTVNAFMVSMISIVILGVLAPIFVPMSLFQYTKGYFESWLKLLISLVLQPSVAALFISIMFTVYDNCMYTGCRYDSYIVQDEFGNNKKAFTINIDPTAYGGITSDDYTSCTQSLGFMLNSPLLSAANLISNATNNTINNAANVGGNILNGGNILSNISNVSGIFFTGPILIGDSLLNLVSSFLTGCFLLYIMYNLSAQLSSFAAELTEGISIDTLSITPQSVMQTYITASDMIKAHRARKQAQQQSNANAPIAAGRKRRNSALNIPTRTQMAQQMTRDHAEDALLDAIRDSGD